jgi:hypothetical protein
MKYLIDCIQGGVVVVLKQGQKISDYKIYFFLNYVVVVVVDVDVINLEDGVVNNTIHWRLCVFTLVDWPRKCTPV